MKLFLDVLSLSQREERHLGYSQVAGLLTVQVIEYIHLQILGERGRGGERRGGEGRGGEGREGEEREERYGRGIVHRHVLMAVPNRTSFLSKVHMTVSIKNRSHMSCMDTSHDSIH